MVQAAMFAVMFGCTSLLQRNDLTGKISSDIDMQDKLETKNMPETRKAKAMFLKVLPGGSSVRFVFIFMPFRSTGHRPPSKSSKNLHGLTSLRIHVHTFFAQLVKSHHQNQARIYMDCTE